MLSLRTASCVCTMLLVAASCLHAQRVPIIPQSPQGIQYDTLARNQVMLWLSNVGSNCRNPADRPGFEWPHGSGDTYMYLEGFLMTCLIQGELRAGGANCHIGWQPGHITDDGASDPDAPDTRLFRARRLDRAGYAALSPAEQQLLRTDYEEWPVSRGAPWTDADGDGGYSPSFENWLDDPEHTDGPAILGDEMLWAVMNDLNSMRVHDLHGTNPVGLEMQATTWAHAQPDCLARTVFTRYRVINKGFNTLDSMYFAIWCDPDVGGGLDDRVGVDTSRNLAYAYNGSRSDEVTGEIGAVGYVLLQGPVVDAPGGTARFRGREIPGMRNLPFTAFTVYTNGTPPYVDPYLRNPIGARMLYNNMRGSYAFGAPFIDPHSGDPTVFMFAGDPVAGTGWLDHDNLPPSDRRFLAAMGPVTMAPGDTQEVIFARIVAEGGSPTEDITALRQTADCVIRHHGGITLAVESLPTENGFSIAGMYPQPVRPGNTLHVTLRTGRRVHGPLLLQMFDLLGRPCAAPLALDAAGRTVIRYPLPSRIPGGMYYLRVTDGTRLAVSRTVLLR